MYLASIKLKNFRKFDEQEHVIHFQEGLNVLVGENDAGKSAIIDAIRIALGTTDSNNFSNVNLSDFYQEDLTRIIEIVCYFKNLTKIEESIFLEYLTYEEEDGEYKTSLYLHWNYGCIKSNGLLRPISFKIAATGKNGDGDRLSKPNMFIYRDSSTGRSVEISLGGIHSVKGRTHLATLVLETFTKTFNIKKLLPQIAGLKKPSSKETSIGIMRFKCQYVAMTRAKALLCLALPIDSVTVRQRSALENVGWNIEEIV